MENLDAALTGKKLEDLTPNEKPTGGSNLLEPTKAEIESIIAELKKGTPYSVIKKTLRRTVGESKPGFSYGQIKEIEAAWKAKIVELTPCEVCGKAPCECPPPPEPEPEEEVSP